MVNKDLYHKDYDGELILDKDGEPILITFCICSAWSENECVCKCPWDEEEYKKVFDRLNREE